MDNTIEIWKDIPEYEGMYQVSNFGNVKSLKFGKEHMLKPGISNDGYYQVVLCKNGKMKTNKIHTLVIKSFNPDDYQKCIDFPRKWVIDHKIEGNKLDNRLSNLQVITFRDNICKSIDKSKTTSKYIGVHFEKRDKKWVASITINRRPKHLGSFENEIDAHLAFEKAKEMLEIGDLSFYVFREKSSKLKCVSFNKNTNKWESFITINGKKKHLGLFNDENSAYDAFFKANEMVSNGDYSFLESKKSSKYKGVSWYKNSKKWIAYINIDGKQKRLGYFSDEYEAHLAVQKALKI